MLSIVTPSYNQRDFLITCIESVRGTRNLLEHLILDSKSKDHSHEILALAEQTDSRVRWLRGRDKNQSNALNELFLAARGDWIGWLNADEYYLPGALEYIDELISQSPQIDVIYGEVIRLNGNSHSKRYFATYPFSRFMLKHYGVFIPSSSFFIRRESLKNITLPFFNEELEYLMDWNFYLKLSDANLKFAFIKRPLSAFVIHQNQKTRAENRAAMLREKANLTNSLLMTSKYPILLITYIHRLRKLLYGSYWREIRYRFTSRDYI